MTEPTTETGRAYVGHSCDNGEVENADAILAIEAEAAEAERARIVSAVKGLLGYDILFERQFDPMVMDTASYRGRFEMPPIGVTITNAPPDSGSIDRAAVLAIVREPTEAS